VVFKNHMRFLADNGYETLGLQEALEAVRTDTKPRKAVVITFDDGYRDFYTFAYPILMKHRFRATMFIISGFTAERRIRLYDREYMTWDEVRAVHEQGIDIGSHTVNHPELYRMQRAEIQTEIRASKLEIENKIGDAVESFAYPFAFPEHDKQFVRMLRGLLQAEGYRTGVSTVIGTVHDCHDRFFLPRIPVNSYDDQRFFEAKLNGAYDWLHSFQYLCKSMKGLSESVFRVSSAMIT